MSALELAPGCTVHLVVESISLEELVYLPPLRMGPRASYGTAAGTTPVSLEHDHTPTTEQKNSLR